MQSAQRDEQEAGNPTQPGVAHRPDRARQPGCAGSDGRCDERRIPGAVSSAGTVEGRHGQRTVCLRDGDRTCAHRAAPGHHAHDNVLRGRITTLAAAVHRRSGHHVCGRSDDRWRRVSRSHRHEFRLPSAQSHQARRRGGATVQTAAIRSDRGRGCARHRRHRYTGDGQVSHWHR